MPLLPSLCSPLFLCAQLQYTTITSIALFAADGAMLAYGELGDRLGPRACFGVGAVLAWFGMLLLSLAARTGLNELWYMALFSIGVSGPGVFMGCLFLGEKYPPLRAVVSAVGAAMWDGSALVLKLFELAYFSSAPTGEPASFGLGSIALCWLVVCVVAGIPTWRALPSRQLLQQLRAAEPSAQPLTQAEEYPPAKGADGPGPVEAATPVSDAQPSVSFLSVFCRTDTKLLLGFMALFNLKSSFYIATFATQMQDMFAPTTAEKLATSFNIAFPVGGFCTSVVASVLLDKLGEREDLYMTLVVLLAIMFGLYNLLPYAAAQFASALLFGPTRTMQWACYFHFLSLPKRYPPQYVGRLLGYGNLVIALVGDVPLSALNAFVLYTTELGDPAARYIMVHFVLQLALLGCLALPWYLHNQFRQARGPAHDDALAAGVDEEADASTLHNGRMRRDDSSIRLDDDDDDDDAAADDDDRVRVPTKQATAAAPLAAATANEGVEMACVGAQRGASSNSGQLSGATAGAACSLPELPQEAACEPAASASGTSARRREESSQRLMLDMD